jgi:hypothetical protein
MSYGPAHAQRSNRRTTAYLPIHGPILVASALSLCMTVAQGSVTKHQEPRQGTRPVRAKPSWPVLLTDMLNKPACSCTQSGTDYE